MISQSLIGKPIPKRSQRLAALNGSHPTFTDMIISSIKFYGTISEEELITYIKNNFPTNGVASIVQPIHETISKCIKDGVLMKEIAQGTTKYRLNKTIKAKVVSKVAVPVKTSAKRRMSMRILRGALDRLNASKPICPVTFSNLVVGWDVVYPDIQAFIYECGHVQGNHNWENGICPTCRTKSARIIPITFVYKPSVHVDDGDLDHVFNPCGHIASKATISACLSKNRQTCSFCGVGLIENRPFIKAYFEFEDI